MPLGSDSRARIASKLKLAGEGKKDGAEVALVALSNGLEPSKENEGTRGIVNARVIERLWN